MRLPNANQAVVPERKITEHLLSVTHRDERSKAIFFMRFGFTIHRWDILADALRFYAIEHDVIEAQNTPFGTQYEVTGQLNSPDGRQPYIRVIWFIETDTIIPRLVTAYPAKEAYND